MIEWLEYSHLPSIKLSEKSRPYNDKCAVNNANIKERMGKDETKYWYL
jgi:hypothetical protein